MPRRQLASEPQAPPPRAGGPLLTIDPNDIFDAQGARAALKLTASTIRREVREGRLRISKRAGRYYLLGRWLLEWIAGGELPTNGRAAQKREGGES